MHEVAPEDRRFKVMQIDQLWRLLKEMKKSKSRWQDIYKGSTFAS